MLSNYEMLSLYLQVMFFMIKIYIDIKNNQPPR